MHASPPKAKHRELQSSPGQERRPTATQQRYMLERVTFARSPRAEFNTGSWKISLSMLRGAIPANLPFSTVAAN